MVKNSNLLYKYILVLKCIVKNKYLGLFCALIIIICTKIWLEKKFWLGQKLHGWYREKPCQKIAWVGTGKKQNPVERGQKSHGLVQGKSKTCPDLTKTCMGWYREKAKPGQTLLKSHGLVQGKSKT